MKSKSIVRALILLLFGMLNGEMCAADFKNIDTSLNGKHVLHFTRLPKNCSVDHHVRLLYTEFTQLWDHARLKINEKIETAYQQFADLQKIQSDTDSSYNTGSVEKKTSVMQGMIEQYARIEGVYNGINTTQPLMINPQLLWDNQPGYVRLSHRELLNLLQYAQCYNTVHGYTLNKLECTIEICLVNNTFQPTNEGPAENEDISKIVGLKDFIINNTAWNTDELKTASS